MVATHHVETPVGAGAEAVDRMRRRAAFWFGLSGLGALIGSGIFLLVEPTYYEAESFGDYISVVTLSGVFVATGIALAILWRHPPVERGSWFLLLAGIGAAAEGLGNLLEDAFDVEAAVWAFLGGGVLMMIGLLVAGVVALADNTEGRWSGLFLLFAVPGAMLGFGLVMMGFSWLLFALWIASRHRGVVVALLAATLPALATATYLYL